MPFRGQVSVGAGRGIAELGGLLWVKVVLVEQVLIDTVPLLGGKGTQGTLPAKDMRPPRVVGK